MEEKLCFVLMPFKDEFKSAWKYAIHPAAKVNGLVPRRADDEDLPVGIVTKDIREMILNADIIIAEMTSQNPNVLYELGLAHSAKKKVIMITQNKDDIPFDIKGQGIRYIEYENNHLDKLEKKLTKQIETTLKKTGTVDLFPELNILTPQVKTKLKKLTEENHHLRSLAYPIEVITNPQFAYIFLNNQYIGIAPQTIRINPKVENIITIFALAHFEEYIILQSGDIPEREIKVKLSRRNEKLYPKRVHGWLKYIRKNPDDIVIGGAIAVYLGSIGEHDEAIKEQERLLTICSNWCILYNGIGIAKSRLGLNKEAIFYYQKVKELEMDSYIGYFNLACQYSKSSKFKQAINELKQLFKNENCVATLCSIDKTGHYFDKDSDFDNIRNHPKYKNKFKKLNQIYKNKCKDISQDTD